MDVPDLDRGAKYNAVNPVRADVRSAEGWSSAAVLMTARQQLLVEADTVIQPFQAHQDLLHAT